MISPPIEKAAARAHYRIWWLNPGWAFTLALLPFAVAAYLISDEQFTYYWRMPRHFDETDLAYTLACIAAFLGGGLFSRMRPARTPEIEWGKFSEPEIKFLYKLFKWGASLTFAAYVIWVLIGVRNGLSFQLLVDGLTGKGGAVYETKSLMTTLPGVTTAIQFEMAVFIIGIILCFNGKAQRVAGWLGLLLFVVMLRSIFNSERLALIETVTPSICLTAFYCRKELARYLRGIASVFWPVCAVVFIYLLFTGSEYGRSWTSFYQEQGDFDNVWEFSLMRLIGYYVTALNNGAYIYQTFGMRAVPWATFQCFWKFPLVGSWAYGQFSPGAGEDYFSMGNESNPEFNNYTAIYDYALDWSQPGAVIFFLLAGILVYKCYRGFVAGTSTGLLLYPLLYVGVLEVARTLYWTSSRAFPSWILLIVAAYGLSRIRRKQARLERNQKMLASAFGPEAPTSGAKAFEMHAEETVSEQAKKQP